MNITHESKHYLKHITRPGGMLNGAYMYSTEIVNRMIPAVKTDRQWVTLRVPEEKHEDGAIVFVHNNLHPERYEYLRGLKDLILVCGVPSTAEKMAEYGTAIYLPLSINVKETKKHKANKTRETAFAGRLSKKGGFQYPEHTDFICGLEHDRFLDELARYRQVYAVGLTALEAKCLGTKILPYDPRFPNVDLWQVLDTLDAAKILQEKLDEIDGGND